MFIETQQAAITPGFFLRARPTGFTVHMNASAAHLHSVRELTDKALSEAGVGTGMSDTVWWVVSELVGNAVRVCGDQAPLVVEVEAETRGVPAESSRAHARSGGRAHLKAAVRALSGPCSTVPLGTLLHGASPDRARPPATNG